MSKNAEEGLSLAALNKEIDQYSTDPAVIQQIEKDFQDVVRDFSGDPDLELFKIKYETLYNSLKEGYENEVRWSRKCKEHNSEIVLYTSKVQMSQKMINDDTQQAEVFQKELEDKWRKTEELKIKEKELRDKIFLGKEEIKNLNKQCERVVDDIEELNQVTLNDKKRAIEELQKNLHAAFAKLSYLRTQNENVHHDLKQEETQHMEYLKEISKIEMEIAKITSLANKEEMRKVQMDEEMAETKKKIDEAKAKQNATAQMIISAKKQVEQQNVIILQRIKEKEHYHNKQKDTQDVWSAAKKESANQTDALKTIKEQIIVQKEELAKLYEENKEALKVVDQAAKELKVAHRIEDQTIKERENISLLRDKKSQEIEEFKIETLTKEMKQRDLLKNEIDSKLKLRTKQTKALKKAEQTEHETDEQIRTYMNDLKKIENQVINYEAVNARIQKQIAQLQREQEKYGIEASQAHAKFYQTVEEVKIKNNQVAELQKKNQEVEAKLKHQQSLYETVRSDRNLYSKNLTESRAEIDELSKRYTRMSHEVEQLKEQIKSRDQQLIKQDYDYHKVEEENNKTKQEKKKVKKNIKSTEEVIKTQDNHISRLKYIIQEAKMEKQRQEKDYEMVVNERDILGTQLIKRNQELNTLFEKIKLAQSSLTKGEINYRDKESELSSLKKELGQLKLELNSTNEQIKCINDLRNEINNLEKDLLNEKNKVKALQDELANPMNVHRWRKLEATDQDNFERILKIQTLQRRLIAKTEEVTEKEALIREKEKLFMELKNILSRQPGVEIHQQLSNYKESLKEKTGQMKKMLGELKASQDQVDVLQFELQNYKEDIMRMKQQYFMKRREEDKAQERAQEKGEEIQDILTQQKNMIMQNAQFYGSNGPLRIG